MKPALKLLAFCFLLMLGARSVAAQTADPIYTRVDHSANFKGGMPAFAEYMKTNLHYPAEERKNKTEGRVIITFVVEKDGSLSGIKVIRSLAPAFDKEALRVIAASPKWMPGFQNGKPVRSQFTVPIMFRL